jgi:glutamate synthase domain-containing protein 2
MRPFDYRCIGFECEQTDHYCVDACEQKALSITKNPVFETLGDCRWTADLIVSTWRLAETGRAPPEHLESETGASGGGFDRLRFRFPPSGSSDLRREDISTELVLNRRNDSREKRKIDVPWYSGGMSFGSTSIRVLLSGCRLAKAWNSFACTGEGGYPDRMAAYADHVITQVATGLFGVREETIQRAPIVEFKYAQGAKPGLGGHLLGDKNTPVVAAMREAVVGTSLFSPFPFHSVYSVEDHKKHLDWIAHINPQALLSAKVSTPVDVDMVAVGSYYAGAHIIHLDGSYGGTGAARGRGCARGITTTDQELLEKITIDWGTQRLVNLYNAWREMLIDILYRLGLDSAEALRGRSDLLRHLDYDNEAPEKTTP